MPRQYYVRNKSLHELPKFRIKAKDIQYGKGESVSILFIILLIVTVHFHRFEIHTMVSEICDNIHLVLGVKTFMEQGEISVRDLNSKFLKTPVP